MRAAAIKNDPKRIQYSHSFNACPAMFAYHFTHEGILVIFFLNKEKPEFQMANKMIFSFIVTYQQKNYSLWCAGQQLLK